jgi:uncharacterized membrane protein YoaK (UPF0700 family)
MRTPLRARRDDLGEMTRCEMTRMGDVVKSLVPGTDARLPLMLLALTAVTGVVDAVSILALGRVFVANMTGNVVFVGFALAGASGFSLTASLFGLVGFLLGAGARGGLIARLGAYRSRLFAVAVSAELALLTGATLVVGLPAHLGRTERDVAVVLLAVAMGMQNAVVRRLAVPDLTTTVLTMTLTGIASDLREGARGIALTRRLLAVVAMFAGAVLGAALVIQRDATAALAIGTGLLALVTATAWRSMGDAPPGGEPAADSIRT